ncbi:hypothetical protein ElyMa_001013900 [Elysia marginata]|uniref:C-type lectin domain-containing protein n=1 Tax=Elysia marginata TaxID=1093978 RepID=A0AAV4HKV3_9GAST|nr:hypothetical protein ElyMa_001013900 [Elysia marginata]
MLILYEAPSCSPEVGWVSTVQQHTLYLSDPAKPANVLTWHDARQACTNLHPQAALASFPRDIYDQTISCKIEPAIPYWVGITAAYPTPSQIFWLDGSLETRSSQFSLDINLSLSNTVCSNHKSADVYAPSTDVKNFSSANKPNFDIFQVHSGYHD